MSDFIAAADRAVRQSRAWSLGEVRALLAAYLAGAGDPDDRWRRLAVRLRHKAAHG